MNLELLDRAAAATTCDILYQGGGALVGAGAVGIVAAGVGFIPFSAGAAMLLAANYGCGPMPLGDAEDSLTTGCIEVESAGTILVTMPNGEQFPAFPPGNMNYSSGRNARRITNTYVSDAQSGQNRFYCYINWEGPNGEEYSDDQYRFSSMEEARKVKWSIEPVNGDCTATSPETKPLPPEMFEPQPYTDEITNCNFNITFQGMAQPVPGGPVKPVYLLQQAADSRADGGVMGGCNWPDTIFMPSDNGGGGGGGDGPIYLPVPDGPTPPDGPGGVPWWAGPLLAAATNAALQLIGQELAKLSEPDFLPGSFTMTAPCDFQENGEPEYRTWEFAEGSFQQRMNAHQVALMEMLQQHLNWKTPTCGNEKPPLEGEWVTTRWQSVETMPHSGHRLRKQFRYRSKSGLPLQERSAYWEWFQWQSGDVCVIHKGAWWGTPQVWAASEEEGKRVIRFAAGEAGIDPDQTGEWKVSRSSSPRYGMSGTMKIQLYKGFPWISTRGGASYPNTLAKVHDP